MAKETETKPVSDRQKRWDAYVENYKKANPTKYAMKIATSWTDPETGKVYPKKNEFAEIPQSFQ